MQTTLRVIATAIHCLASPECLNVEPFVCWPQCVHVGVTHWQVGHSHQLLNGSDISWKSWLKVSCLSAHELLMDAVRCITVKRVCVCVTFLKEAVTQLWHCWLGSRKGIWAVKKWVVGCWRGYLSGARCWLAYGSADATATHCLLLQ